MSTKPTLPDDSRATTAQAAIDRDSVLLLNELQRLLEPLPAKLAPLVAAESDVKKARAIIDREIRRVLREFNAAKKAMLDKIASTQH